MPKLIRLIDRTRTVQDWKCPRSRYLGYELDGRGIVAKGTSLELTIGIIVHDALAAIATFQRDGQPIPIDLIAETAYKDVVTRILGAPEAAGPETIVFAKEQGTLIEGMLRGFYKHVWPALMEKYPKIISIEAEMEYPLSSYSPYDLRFMTKPDLIVEDQEGNLVYIEYKTTSSKQDKWINSWDTQVQLHSSIKATEATLGREVSSVQIVGLYKGYESYGKQSSPFCYAYSRYGNPPFTKTEIAYEFKVGFKRTPTWELEGGVKKWVDDMPTSVLANQFPMTAPIFVNNDLVEAFFRQRAWREDEIAGSMGYISEHPEVLAEELDVNFPQRFDQCQPSFGWPCQFKKICHGDVKDPYVEGFEPREPHHASELAQLGLTSVDDGSEEIH